MTTISDPNITPSTPPIPPTSTIPTKVEIPATVELPAAAVVSQPHSLPPTTTQEEQRVTQGQRTINKLWEMTQAVIAIEVTSAAIAACFILIFKYGAEVTTVLTALQLLSNACFLIVGFYFSRTNHTKTGGVTSDQTGR